MKIRLANTAGFCMGVRRAVDMVLDLQRAAPPVPIVTYGPLIHNPQTLDLLASRGIRQVSSLEAIDRGTVVIRAHGISPQERQILKDKGVKIIDATCPRVARVQAVIRKHAARGHFCVIVGDADHPEVRGLLGFASAGGLALSGADDPDMPTLVPRNGGICVVAQTTQEVKTFDAVVRVLREQCSDVQVYNTICDSTKKRQSEVARLARQVDMIVVVGGKGSGNTRRLVQVAEAQHIPSLHVETEAEMESEDLAGAEVIGVTAGASTPNWQIRRVIDRLKEIGMSRQSGFPKRLRRLADITVMTYGWAALGGGGLSATCQVLQGRPVSWLPVAVTMLFVFSMHLLNRLQERSGAVRFNTPDIAEFYARHRNLLGTLALVSSVAAVVLSYQVSIYACVLLFAMVVAGRLYTEPILSASTLPKIRWRSLKDLPGSKTPLVAAGWAVSATVVPVLGSVSDIHVPALVVSFLFAAGMVFWRTAMSDLLDIQGDRIVGRETIPILIGVKRTRRMLLGLLGALAVLLIGSAAGGLIPPIGYWLITSVLVFGAFLMLFRRRHLVDRLWFEGVIDGNFVLAGLVSMAYGIS
ncbi:MAG: 4-hydroxy-3-methylbut-2-enyl diphosphate reductase [Desulfomonilaceae bacterium]|nr:4-hydroxy-3-methylbut-2-enyl diphosphate reductase [Desulfomonilaceae bacterium]